jgi:alpha-glucosidase
LRFWFERGVDGIRIDSAALLCKDATLPGVDPAEPPGPAHPFVDRDDVHEIYQSWRAIADEASGRVLIGEVWLPDAARLTRYVNPGRAAHRLQLPVPDLLVAGARAPEGEELGRWEVQDIPDELRQDPIWQRTGGADPGRDGCRVPLPWSGTEAPFGFSPPSCRRTPQSCSRAAR